MGSWVQGNWCNWVLDACSRRPEEPRSMGLPYMQDQQALASPSSVQQKELASHQALMREQALRNIPTHPLLGLRSARVRYSCSRRQTLKSTALYGFRTQHKFGGHRTGPFSKPSSLERAL